MAAALEACWSLPAQWNELKSQILSFKVAKYVPIMWMYTLSNMRRPH
jgi:hypothetical protein